MWYDNPEDETVSNKPAAAGENEALDHGGSASQHRSAGSVFPGSEDPTKAFADDSDEVPGGAPTSSEVSAFKSAIKELEEKANLNYDRYLRALAELENYKKRMSRDRTELMRYAGEDLLLEILPVVDNLERTLVHSRGASDVKKVLEGIELIHRQFLKSLEKSGITRIEEAPCVFDPAIHQALQRVEDKSVPDDTVVEVLQKGYALNGKVVRPAMVKVAKH